VLPENGQKSNKMIGGAGKNEITGGGGKNTEAMRGEKGARTHVKTKKGGGF